jgi:hypothetical protein
VHFGLNDIRDLPRLEEFGDLIGENINDDLVAAINAAEPGTDNVIEVASDESDVTNPGDEAPVAAEETQLESTAREANEE